MIWLSHLRFYFRLELIEILNSLKFLLPMYQVWPDIYTFS